MPMPYTPYHQVTIDFKCNAENGCGKIKSHDIKCARDPERGHRDIVRFLRSKGWRVHTPNLLCPTCNRKEKRNAVHPVHHQAFQ